MGDDYDDAGNSLPLVSILNHIKSVRSPHSNFLEIRFTIFIIIICHSNSGFGGLGVACWPLVPKVAGSNPAEAVGFLKGRKKSSARLPSEGK